MNAVRRLGWVLGGALLLLGPVAAKPWWLKGVQSNESDFLDPDVAYRAGFRVEGNALRVHWIIADGYYLYRQKMEILPESPDLTLGAAQFPPGIQKTDPYLGTQEIFEQQVTAWVPFSRTDAGAHPLQIKVTYQGCAEAGLCYPPITKVLFAEVAPPPTPNPSHPWEGIAIVGGVCAFLLAGLMLRKNRSLTMPAA